MCGILGFNYEDKDFLKKALNKIEHRGPDDSGIYLDKNVSLGHNRLSILDLSKSGRQPMSNKDETVWITFNGEIYNFKELRKELEKKYDFKSNTDTEVLIYLYEEHGMEMLNKLQGMFAFCIYDKKKNLFFIARDRIGIKPLYYYHNNKKFIFCSEIKGILEDKEIKREVNLESLSSFLIFRANTKEETIFKNIKKLIPGNFLIYDLEKSVTSLNEYWNLPNKIKNNDKKESLMELKELLDDSVKSRLISDVPYGAYLSGGIDSGIIVSLMSKYSSQPIKTFSVGFLEEEHSEVEEARFLAEKLKTNHKELIIEENSIKKLPEIIYHADEPMSDPTSIPIYFLSEYAKKYCTVILTGEGADEVFAGYPQYKFMIYHQDFLRKSPLFLRKILPLTIKKTPNFILNKGFKFAEALGEKGIERFSKFINSNSYPKQYLELVSIFNEKEQSELFNKNIRFYEYYKKYFPKINRNNLLINCQRLDFKEPMVEDLLMKIDKNTMAHSIEARVPFLDHRITELGFSLPSNLKLKLFKTKYILREISKNIIPEQTRKRKKKHFFVPIDNWFKGDLSSLKEELLSEKNIKNQNIFNYNYINKINKDFKKSKLFYSRQLWSLLTFQIWYKLYIEKEKVKI